jgi:nicotinamide mononucleotide adenylyltransferase
MDNIASVHGRFQPPHLDHLEYMLAALQQAEHLVIGITQPDSSHLAACPEDPHRSETSSNPLSFDERVLAISAMLLAEGVAASRFSFKRFPIEMPELLLECLSTDVTCLTTIRDQWNVVKISRLRSLGYHVRVLWDRSDQKGRSGTEIRKRIEKFDEGWKSELHPAVVSYLIDSGILKRMQSSYRE